MSVTLNTLGKRGPDASELAVRQRLCSEENVEGPLCQPLPEEIWKIVAEHLQGTDLKNLSKVSHVCQQAALREKNIQEMNTAIQEIQALSNLNPAEPNEAVSALDVYQHILLGAGNVDLVRDFYHDAMIDPAKLPDLQQKLHELSTKKAAAVFESLKHTCFQNIQDKKASVRSIEEQYNLSQHALVVEALELKISSAFNTKLARGAAVIVAAQKGHLKMVQALLANKDLRQVIRGDAVFAAARDGHLAVVQFLLTNGATISEAARGWAVVVAAQYGHLEIVQALLANGEITKRSRNKLLVDSINNHNSAIFKCILENTRISQKSNEDFEACIIEGIVPRVKLCAINREDLKSNFQRFLNLAASNGHKNLVEYLSTQTCLYENTRKEAIEAAQNNHHTDIVEVLYKYTPYERSVLVMEAKQGHLDRVQDILKSSEIGTQERGLALLVAADEGHLEIVKVLMGLGFINQDRRAYALKLAVQKGHLGIVKELLANGPIDRIDRAEAFFLAWKLNHREILSILA